MDPILGQWFMFLNKHRGKITKHQIDQMWQDLRDLHNEIVTREAKQAMRGLAIGDLAQFAKGTRTVTIRIESLNQKSVSGVEMNGEEVTTKRWRVAPSLLKRVA